MDNITYSAYLKIAVKRLLRSQKFWLARMVHRKPSKPITNRKAWQDVHQRYEMSESKGHHHEGNEEDKQKYYSFLLDIPSVYDMGGKKCFGYWRWAGFYAITDHKCFATPRG